MVALLALYMKNLEKSLLVLKRCRHLRNDTIQQLLAHTELGALSEKCQHRY
jgi:hypothetical protein